MYKRPLRSLGVFVPPILHLSSSHGPSSFFPRAKIRQNTERQHQNWVWMSNKKSSLWSLDNGNGDLFYGPKVPSKSESEVVNLLQLIRRQYGVVPRKIDDRRDGRWGHQKRGKCTWRSTRGNTWPQKSIRKNEAKTRITVFENHPKSRISIFEFWHFPTLFVQLKLTF